MDDDVEEEGGRGGGVIVVVRLIALKKTGTTVDGWSEVVLVCCNSRWSHSSLYISQIIICHKLCNDKLVHSIYSTSGDRSHHPIIFM